MAIAIVLQQESKLPGGGRVAHYEVTFDNSYPSGGETFDPSDSTLSPWTSQNEFTTVHGMVPKVRYTAGATGGADTEVQWDEAATKLWLLVGSTGVEVAGATDKSTLVCDVLVWGL